MVLSRERNGMSVTDILFVEDNLELANLIQLFLVKAGYQVQHVESGEKALDYLRKESAKLLLLDINLPGMDGFAVCRAIRRTANIPILILSARVEKADKLTGFELGADDYIEKTIDPDILVAKVGAIMQRTYLNNSQSELLISGQITIDQTARKVYLEQEVLDMNAKEYELLLLLIKNPGKTLNKDFLFNTIWGVGYRY